MHHRFPYAPITATLLLLACLGAASCNKDGARKKAAPDAAGAAAAATPLALFEKDLCKPENAARIMLGAAITEYTARLNYAQFPTDSTLEEYLAEVKALAAEPPAAAPPAPYDACAAQAKPMACTAVYDQIAKDSLRMIEEQKALFADVSDDYLEDLDLPEAATTEQAAAAGRAMGITGCASVSIDASRGGDETLSAVFFAGNIGGRMQLFYMNPDNTM
jgi:hypothetical protein